MEKHIKLSDEFRKQSVKAIIAIIFFIITYLVLLSAAIILAILCIYLGFKLITVKIMWASILLGIGLASLGALILIFLIKFLFKHQKTDRSNLIEITSSDEPALFEMIRDIVREVGTKHPKKVYLSADVNAAVFYDSGFWSMFLPVRKNLLIGMGLVNSVTEKELKAILAHEFGHFSQRTMKLGSYVYNVNKVIYNMLYDNSSYDNLIQGWANLSVYFSIFVSVGVKIIQGIQEILKLLYENLNRSYLALSREMEFHADEIAAGVTGYEPLTKSLLRLSMAESAYNNVLNFYNGKIEDNFKSKNLFSDHSQLILFYSQQNNLPVTNNLPDITVEEQSKYDKSKLVFKDQWASHPSVEDRIKRLESTGYHAVQEPEKPANSIFRNLELYQQQLTDKIFSGVQYKGDLKLISYDEFIVQFKKEHEAYSFSKIYNGYYDHKSPAVMELQEIGDSQTALRLSDLFSDEKVDLVYTIISLQNDIETLKQISGETTGIKTFEYDGRKYQRKDADDLVFKLTADLERLNEQLIENDKNIYSFFKLQEATSGVIPRLEQLYKDYFTFGTVYDSKFELYTKFVNDLQFVQHTTPYDDIENNFIYLEVSEEKLKDELIKFLADDTVQTEITAEMREKMQQYISQKWKYFNGTNYIEENLQILYAAVNYYSNLLALKGFHLKKRILVYQEQLLDKTIRA